MVAVKSLWVLLKSFSTNFSFKRESGVKVPDKPDKRIRYNRLRPQWHRPYYPSADPEIGSGNMASGSSNSFVTSSKSYQDYLNGNCGVEGENKFGGGPGQAENYHNSKDFENFINSDSDYEDGDSDAEDFDDDFTTTDEDEDSDLDDEDECEEILECEVCDRTFPTIKKLSDHQQKKRHYGCVHCDSVFPTPKALQFHREQMDHFDFVSDYGTGTDDTASFGSGSVVDQSSSGSGNGNVSSSQPQRAGGGDENTKCPSTTTSTSGTGPGRCCSGRRHNNNNNYYYGNQLHSSWYEGDDEEEKGLLRN